MKTLRYLGMVLVTILMSVAFTSCGDDDDDVNTATNSIVGSWQQTNSAGTKITVTFSSNKSGFVTYVFYDDNDKQTGSSTENFEYSYNEDEGTLKIYGDTQLDGTWNVTITATMLILEPLDGTAQYRFNKV